MNGSKVTLRMVAEEAGCSHAVVSKVLNNSKSSLRVSVATGDRIREAADRLGYTPNYLAQSLKRGQSFAVGYLGGGGSLGTDLWGQVIDGIASGLAAHGYDLVLVSASADEDSLDRASRYVSQGRIDALIVNAISHRHSLARIKALTVQPVYVLGRRDGFEPHVSTKQSTGIAQAIRHLKELGHTEVLWFGPDDEYTRRWEHLREAAATHGIVAKCFSPGIAASGVQDAIKAAREAFGGYLAESGPLPHAIMAYNDVRAIGICSALRDAGMRVPEDVSVIGYDDIHAEFCSPALTTVSQSMFQVGEATAEVALMAAGGKDISKLDCRLIDTRLVIRESTGAAADQTGGRS